MSTTTNPKETPRTLADLCFDEDRNTDKLFSEINRIMGGRPLGECGNDNYQWACTDLWVDGYDQSVEIIRGPDWPPLTQEQATAILDLGFGCIYESPANADKTSRDGISWSRAGKGWCMPKNHGDDNVRMVKAIRRAEKLEAELSEATAKVAELEEQNDKLTDQCIGMTMIAGDEGVRLKVHSKQVGIIQDLRDQLSTASAALEESGKKSDAEMLRVKACEHIAEGIEGWERLRNECPSTAAVASLRDALQACEGKCAQMREALEGLLEDTFKHECGNGGQFFSTNQRHARNALASTGSDRNA